nr:MAG TPA: TFIIB zinc-binding [Caudoviricetes sp.]
MRLIDRDAIHWRPDENWELYATAADIRAIPTVDAVVVTRCKDCEHKERATVNGKGFLICPASGMEITPDDFCSYGEPKEG